MKSQPHSLIASFERRILRTLDIAYYVSALYYLWHRAWFLGIALVILSFGTGAIGQGLPHRKHETTAELADGSTFAGEFEGNISDEDSGALGRGLFKTCGLVGLTAVLILWHHNWKWCWILLTVPAVWFASFALFLLFTIGPLTMLQNIRKQHRLY